MKMASAPTPAKPFILQTQETNQGFAFKRLLLIIPHKTFFVKNGTVTQSF